MGRWKFGGGESIQELVAAVVEGDPRSTKTRRSFEALLGATPVEAAVAQGARVGLGVLGVGADFDDVVAKSQFEIWKALQSGSFDGRSKFETWAYALSRNVGRNHVRTEGRSARRHLRAVQMTTPTDLHVPDAAHALAESSELASVLAKLSESDREVLFLRYVEELDYNEIAERLYLSSGGVGAKLHRARERAASIARGLP